MTLLEDLEKIGTDVEGTLKRFSGAKELYIKFLQRLPENENFPKLEALVNTENEEYDYKNLEIVAHSLKGNTGNLGLTFLWNYLANIEKAGREKNPDKIKENFDKFYIEYKKVIDIINNCKIEE
ncbi:MAG: Hpt domain-containing protein [Oscillospiraceae bacterium]|jgi:HPt (histidine-containing phosphotransfer) domain-containing protein|nr:Hpt domain-containing protein [Oscillospiraceae bacterium]